MYGPVNKRLVPWHDHDPCHFGGKHTKNTLPGPSDKHLGPGLGTNTGSLAPNHRSHRSLTVSISASDLSTLNYKGT